MRQKNKAAPFLACVVLLGMLCGCQRVVVIDPPGRASTDMPQSSLGGYTASPESVAFPDMGPLREGLPEACLSEAGLYDFSRTGYNKGLILYTDFAQKEQRPLCNRENCPHKDNTCEAWLDDLICKPAWVNGRLMLIYFGPNGANPEATAHLVEIDPVTLQRETVADYGPATQLFNHWTDGRYLVIYTEGISVSEGPVPGQETSVEGPANWMVFDSATRRTMILNDVPHGRTLGMWGTTLVTGSGDLFQMYDFKTGTTTEEQHPLDANRMGNWFVDGKYYDSEVALTEHRLQYYSFETRKTVIVAEDLPYDAFNISGIYEPYVFGYTSDNSTFTERKCIIDLGTGEFIDNSAGQYTDWILGEYGDDYVVKADIFYETYVFDAGPDAGRQTNNMRIQYGLIPKAGFLREEMEPCEPYS